LFYLKLSFKTRPGMIRFLLCILFSVFCFAHTSAQTKDTLYFTKNMQALKNKKGAEYYGIHSYLDQERTKRTVTIHYISGEKYAIENQVKGNRKGNKDYKKHGLSSYYHQNGALHHTIAYKDGLKHGPSFTYDRDGKTIIYTTEYADGLKHGPALTYYSSGKLKRQEVFEANKLISGKCFTQSGADTTYFPKDQAPTFAGGEEVLNKLIKMNLRYPAEALRNGIDGLVVVTFTVYKDGSMSAPRVEKSVHYALDDEALRVINLTKGKWIPGTREGMLADRKKGIPIRFGIQKDRMVNKTRAINRF
jgi:TonB family protein